MRYTRSVGRVPLPPCLGPRGTPLRAYSGLDWEGMSSLGELRDWQLGNCSFFHVIDS